MLRAYAWPGNVRELENVVERFAMACLETGGVLTVDRAKALLDAREEEELAHDLALQRGKSEKALVRGTLQQYSGNRAMAARQLGVSRTTLWRLMKRHSLGA